MPQFAEDQHFFDAHRFIVDVGTLEAPLVKDLLRGQHRRRRGEFGLTESLWNPQRVLFITYRQILARDIMELGQAWLQELP